MCRPDSRRCARDGALRSPTMRVLLVTPPMTQLNTPYPATAYLTGFCACTRPSSASSVTQADASLELFLRLFSRRSWSGWLDELRRRARAAAKRERVPPSIAHFLAHAERYVATVEPAMRFLQGRDPSFALRIVGRALPARRAALRASPAVAQATRRRASRGGVRRARLDGSRATSRASTSTISRTSCATASTRASSSRATPSGSPRARRRSIRCARRSTGEPTLVDDDARRAHAPSSSRAQRPDVVGLTVPFPGNVYGAFRIARAIKRGARPTRRIVLGGGYVNTELRELSRAARVRLRRLHDARRRRAAAAARCRASAGPSAPLVAHLRARGRRGRARERRRAARRAERATPARRPTTGCRSIATCRCSRCSTRCTGCGPTGAGTS